MLAIQPLTPSTTSHQRIAMTLDGSIGDRNGPHIIMFRSPRDAAVQGSTHRDHHHFSYETLIISDTFSISTLFQYLPSK